MSEEVKTFSKKELISEVATRTDKTQKEVQEVVDTTLDVIVEKVSERVNVTLAGFGTFASSYRKARKGRNPLTGEELDIAAKHVPTFKAAKRFKTDVL